MTHFYRLCGLKVAADLPLPELPRWEGPADGAPDLAFRIGAVPEKLDGATHRDVLFETRGTDAYLMTLPGVGRALAAGGTRITIDPEDGADAVAVRALLMGPAQAVLWYQRGLLPLHASSIAVDGAAVAIAGASATGKSTLAALLAQRGLPLLSDDITVVDTARREAPLVLPGYAGLRLWRDSLDRLGIAAPDLPRALPGVQKFVLGRGDALAAEALPLSCVIILARQQNGKLEARHPSGMHAVNALHDTIHVRRVAAALGRDRDIFEALTGMCAAGIAVKRLIVPSDLAQIEAIADRVLDVARGGR